MGQRDGSMPDMSTIGSDARRRDGVVRADSAWTTGPGGSDAWRDWGTIDAAVDGNGAGRDPLGTGREAAGTGNARKERDRAVREPPLHGRSCLAGGRPC